MLTRLFCLLKSMDILFYRRGNTALLQQLIETGGDINLEAHHKMTPLHIAGWFGHREVVKLLINLGESGNSAIGNINSNSMIHLALHRRGITNKWCWLMYLHQSFSC